MANLVLIIGESGTGKSTSIETLDPKETFIFQVIPKPLPFKGYMKNYPIVNFSKGTGNRYVSDNYTNIIKVMGWVKKQKHIKNIIVDDFQYLLSNEFMSRVMERGYDKFTEMAKHYYDVITAAQYLREDQTIVFLSHSETKDDGVTKVKTIGKLLDEKVTIEGLFTIVLNTKIEDGEYFFETQNSGFDTSKSPKGMFEEYKIPNDLNYVVTKINEYYGG